jgi:hypothetical protein
MPQDKELTGRIIGAAITVHKEKTTKTEFGWLLNFASMPLTIKRAGWEDALRTKINFRNFHS